VFGEDGRPFAYEPALARAREAWEAKQLEPLGLHEARHTAASVMIAAGVNVKALSEFLGHASITITLDRYGHLLPGSIAEAATLLDAYLARTSVRTSAPGETSLQIGDSARSRKPLGRKSLEGSNPSPSAVFWLNGGGPMKCGRMWGRRWTPLSFLVPLSPWLAWRGSLPGTPDCCL
jgi:Phage integrase family